MAAVKLQLHGDRGFPKRAPHFKSFLNDMQKGTGCQETKSTIFVLFSGGSQKNAIAI